MVNPMDSGFQYGDIIFLALVAAFIALRLRSMLGRNTGLGSPEAPLPPRTLKAEEIVQRAEKAIRMATPDEDEKLLAAITDEDTKTQLAAIRAADAGFSLQEFLRGARAAFDMVLVAFNDGDKDTLKMLLSPALYATFSGELERRESETEKHDTTLVSIKSADVIGALLKDKTIAQITIKFISEQIHVTRDAKGAIVSGNPSTLVQVEDHWTFERDVRSRNPNWTIIDT